jgi:hypothetical protein
MSSSFYIVLPSNTNIEGNRTNSFRVRLPRKLHFGSEWQVGLAVLVYPHSWPSLGTVQEQAIKVVWRSGESIPISIAQSSLTNPQQLKESINKALRLGSEELAKKVRTVQWDFGTVMARAKETAEKERKRLLEAARHQLREKGASAVADIQETGDLEGAKKVIEKRQADAIEAEAERRVPSSQEMYRTHLNMEIAKLSEEDRHILDYTKELGLEAWVHAYRNTRLSMHFDFDNARNRFSITLDKNLIERVELTEQLAYILGFDHQVLTESAAARFMPDMNGGVSSMHVYAPGLVEPMIIGDVCAPVLRIVTIRGQQDEIVEEQFISIQYHKILVREIAELLIEIRTASGVLMPFQYGTCTLTLHFKKAAYF